LRRYQARIPSPSEAFTLRYMHMRQKKMRRNLNEMSMTKVHMYITFTDMRLNNKKQNKKSFKKQHVTYSECFHNAFIYIYTYI
jgi:hypothetical protein